MKPILTINSKIFHHLTKRISLSNLAIIVIGLMVLGTDIKTKVWEEEKVIEIDVLAYYAYLPAIVIFDDLKLGYFYQSGPHHEHITDKAWFTKGPDNQDVIPVSYGLSVLYSPFFLLAHIYAKHFDLAPYGYSWPYQLAIQLAALFYLILGLFVLKKILRIYFNDFATACTLFAVVIGTNLLYYSSIEAGMSHVYNFVLITIFLWLLIKWLNKPRFLTTLTLGLTAGFVVLARPSNLLIISLFIFWGISNLKELIHRLQFFLRNTHKVLLIIFVSFMVWIPQFLYWKYITGQYLFFSYGDKVGFFWTDPQISNILFSYRKGWLLYTPLMILAIAGIPFLIKHKKKVAIPVTFILISYIYVLSCWCFWWFGGSFGSRGFIDIYGIMALPLAAIISYFLTSKKLLLKVSFFSIFFLLIAYNLFEIVQYRNGAIHWGHMTKEAYWSSFGSTHPRGNFYELLKEPPYEEVKQKLINAKNKKDLKNR